jgi:hypothetical protein
VRLLPRRHSNRILALLLALSLIRGVLYSAIIPPWQTPDEPDHFQYVAFLARYHRPPTRQDIAADEWPQTQVYASMQAFNFWALRAHTLPPPVLEEEYRAAVSHPPLYYLLGAFLLTPFTRCDLITQLQVMRLGSVLLGTLTVLVAYLTAQALFPEDASWQLAIPAFVTFLPMHTFITSSVNNDSLAELLASLVIYSLLRILKAGPSWRRVTGVACLSLLGILTKRTTTFTIPLAILTIINTWGFWSSVGRDAIPPYSLNNRHGLNLQVLLIRFCLKAKSRKRFVWLLIISAIGLGLWALISYSPSFILHSLLSILHPSSPIALSFLLTFASFWADFGWMNVPLDLGWYAALAVLSLLALCGLGLFAIRVMRGTEPLKTWQRQALLMLLLAIVLIFAQTFGLIIARGIHQQGRYLFPALIPLAVFFTLGLREWVPVRHRGFFPLALVLGMFVLDSVSLCCYIIPYFYG